MRSAVNATLVLLSLCTAAALTSCANVNDGELADVHVWAAGGFGPTPDAGETTGVVFRSLDGGRSWAVSLQTEGPLSGVSFADQESGWAVGPGAQVWRTTDGGKGWENEGPRIAADLGLSPEAFFGSVKAISESRVVISGIADPSPIVRVTPVIATSDDGGRTWARSSITRDGVPLSADAPNSICITRSGAGIGANEGFRPVTLLTSDFGRSWQDESERVPAAQSTCAGERTLWILQNERVLRSNDGGATWEDRTGNLAAFASHIVGLFGLWFNEMGIGVTTTWADAGGLVILATRTGGGDWFPATVEPAPLGESAALLDVAFAGSTHAVGVGVIQPIGESTLARPLVYLTNDGARTWVRGDLGDLAAGFGELTAVTATAP